MRDIDLLERAKGLEALQVNRQGDQVGCRLCPHHCQVDRRLGGKGRCGIGTELVVSSHGAHFGEEAPLVGRGGSGTIFLAGCNLACIFCQNWDISHGRQGRPMTEEAVARVMLHLQEQGCHNINWVTPTHQLPGLVRALALARRRGCALPVVYNCGGFESLEALALLEGVVDIYMPDVKFLGPGVARSLCGTSSYPEVVRGAVREMHRQVGDLVLDSSGVALRGLLVRHLVLPGDLGSTGKVMAFLGGEISRDTYINVMGQYRPCYRAHEFPGMGRRPSAEEMDRAHEQARAAGLHRFG